MVVFWHFQGEGVEFFKSDLTDPPQIFDVCLLLNTNFCPSELKTLKKFRFDKQMRKNGQFKIELWCEQSWESFTEFLHSDRPVKIMTLWKRRGRHENFGDVARGRQVRLPGYRFELVNLQGILLRTYFFHHNGDKN